MTSAWVDIVHNDSHVIALRSDRHVYNLFGGGVDRGETPRDAARRELFEEAGVAVISSNLKNDITVCKNTAHVFEYRPGTSKITITLNDENRVYYWCTLGDIARLPLHAVTQAWIVKKLRFEKEELRRETRIRAFVGVSEVGEVTVSHGINLIHGFNVISDYRDKGFGRALMEHVIANFEGSLRLHAFPDTGTIPHKQLVAFYESLGFKNAGPHMIRNS